MKFLIKKLGYIGRNVYICKINRVKKDNKAINSIEQLVCFIGALAQLCSQHNNSIR